MKRYMLDTNTVSHLIKAHPTVARQVVAAPMASLLHFGHHRGRAAFWTGEDDFHQLGQLGLSFL